MGDVKEMITLNDGKYTFYTDDRGILRCKRYEDKDWRDFIGDNAVYALFNECLRLRGEIQKIEQIRGLYGIVYYWCCCRLLLGFLLRPILC